MGIWSLENIEIWSLGMNPCHEEQMEIEESKFDEVIGVINLFMVLMLLVTYTTSVFDPLCMLSDSNFLLTQSFAPLYRQL